MTHQTCWERSNLWSARICFAHHLSLRLNVWTFSHSFCSFLHETLALLLFSLSNEVFCWRLSLHSLMWLARINILCATKIASCSSSSFLPRHLQSVGKKPLFVRNVRCWGCLKDFEDRSWRPSSWQLKSGFAGWGNDFLIPAKVAISSGGLRWDKLWSLVPVCLAEEKFQAPKSQPRGFNFKQVRLFCDRQRDCHLSPAWKRAFVCEPIFLTEMFLDMMSMNIVDIAFVVLCQLG